MTSESLISESLDGAPAPTLLQALVPLLRRPVAAADRQRAARHLADWLACSLLGRRAPVGVRLAALWRDQAASGEHIALALGRADLGATVFFNATLGNILEMDDVHRQSTLHPGPVTIPVAIALAELRGADATALLDAIVRGYEAVIRIGSGLGRAHYAYWHSTSTAGAFGAAAAAASLLELDDAGWVSALANAGTRTGGLWQMRHESCDSKQLHNGWAALTGLQAAQAAAVGLRGPAALLEGPQGLFAATAAGGDPGAVLAEPDGPWLLWLCSFKPWPACRHVHPAIDCALQAGSGRPIERALLETYADALKFCDRPEPTTELEAKFSLQHAVAVTLLRGEPQLHDFDAAARTDAELATWRRRIEVRAAADLSGRYPNHYGARLYIEYADGGRFNIQLPDTLGDPQRPLDEAGSRRKNASLLAAAGWSPERADALLRGCLALAEPGADAGAWKALLAATLEGAHD